LTPHLCFLLDFFSIYPCHDSPSIPGSNPKRQASKSGAITKVRETLSKFAPPAPTAEEKAARRAASVARAAQHRPPQPVQGPKRPYHLRPLMNAGAAAGTAAGEQAWPLPHPNWYRYPTQKIFRSAMAKRENHGPLTYPVFEAPRLRESAPRSHLLSEQQLIRDALPGGGLTGAPLRLPSSLPKRGQWKKDSN
jgi:hypothetical protein